MKYPTKYTILMEGLDLNTNVYYAEKKDILSWKPFMGYLIFKSIFNI